MEFEVVYNQDAYLFMNRETLNELMKVFSFKWDSKINGTYYYGRRVYENENLKFGEVEIR